MRESLLFCIQVDRLIRRSKQCAFVQENSIRTFRKLFFSKLLKSKRRHDRTS